MVRNFKFNMAMELVNAAARYACRERVEKTLEDIDYNYDMGIVEWIGEIRPLITSFMERELEDLFGDMNLNRVCLTILIEEREIKEPGEFLDILKDMTGRDYLKLVYNSVDMDFSKGIDSLKDEISRTIDEKYIRAVYDMVENPDETIERIYYILKKFYEGVFSKYEDRVKSILSDKLEEHRKIYESMGDKFIKIVAPLGDSFWKKYKNVDLYLTYFFEAMATGSSISEDKLFVIYGYRMEYRVDRELISERRKLLFKVLADEKRVEVIKLISKRPWYGNELAQHLKITTATLSYHMSKLVFIDIVSIEEGENNRVYYKLDRDKLRKAFEEAYFDIVE